MTLYSPLYANIHDIYTHPRYTVRRSGSDNQVTVSLETLTALARVSFIWYRTSLSVETPESVIHSAFSDLFNYKNTLFHLKEKKKKKQRGMRLVQNLYFSRLDTGNFSGVPIFWLKIIFQTKYLFLKCVNDERTLIWNGKCQSYKTLAATLSVLI